jgi:cytochrome c5
VRYSNDLWSGLTAQVNPLSVQVHAQLPAWAPESTLAKQAGAAATAAALWASLALGAGAADLSSGEEVFTNNCAACHTGGANVVQAEKTLQKDALVQYLDGGFKVESIVTQARARTGFLAASLQEPGLWRSPGPDLALACTPFPCRPAGGSQHAAQQHATCLRQASRLAEPHGALL